MPPRKRSSKKPGTTTPIRTDLSKLNNRLAKQPTVLTVTYPEQIYSPISYNSFRVGGITLSITVETGESVRNAFGELQAELEVMVEEQFERVAAQYLDRVAKAAEIVNAGKR